MKTVMYFIFITWMTLVIPFAALADDNYELEGHKDENQLAEEFGEVMGWAAIALAVVTVALFPAKKIVPIVMRKRTNLTKKSAFYSGILKRLHMPVGITILFLVAWHGVLLFWAEGEFGTLEWIGTASLFLVLIGGLFGAS